MDSSHSDLVQIDCGVNDVADSPVAPWCHRSESTGVSRLYETSVFALNKSTEVVDQHQVSAPIDFLRVEDGPAIGGDTQPPLRHARKVRD